MVRVRRLASIDPAKNACAWATFDDGGRLVRARLIRAKTRHGLRDEMSREFEREPVGELVVEVPQIYRQRSWAGDPTDNVDVAVTAGMAIALIDARKIVEVRPRAWKGTRPKDVCNRLTMSKLDESERRVVGRVDCPPSLLHNVIDAVGIGLWRLRRR